MRLTAEIRPADAFPNRPAAVGVAQQVAFAGQPPVEEMGAFPVGGEDQEDGISRNGRQRSDDIFRLIRVGWHYDKLETVGGRDFFNAARRILHNIIFRMTFVFIQQVERHTVVEFIFFTPADEMRHIHTRFSQRSTIDNADNAHANKKRFHMSSFLLLAQLGRIIHIRL